MIQAVSLLCLVCHRMLLRHCIYEFYARSAIVCSLRHLLDKFVPADNGVVSVSP